MTTSESGRLLRDDFLIILEGLGVPEHVKRHCMAVGDVAVNICAALIKAGFTGIDAEAVNIAGHLHDVCRAMKDHDTNGAELLQRIDFKGEYGRFVTEETRAVAADIVARHMRLNFPERLLDIDSAAIVSLADRTVKEDTYVGYEARMEDLKRRHVNTPEVEVRVRDNMGRALSLISQIEAFTGEAFHDIAQGGRVDIAPVLRLVERPGRYIGGEMNSVCKDWNSVKFRFCFAFPDLYEIGMSYTGIQILYGLLNTREDSLCERVFTPAEDMSRLLEERGLPLFSLENRMPVRRFDMVGFTLQYELCFTNVVRMLNQAKIPLYASERSADDPFVIAGGPCIANAEPVAPFFDLLCVGDGEDMLLMLSDVYLLWQGDDLYGQDGKKDREVFLRMASKIPGIYAPAFYEPVYTPLINDRFSEAQHISVFSHYEKRYDELPDLIERAVVSNLDETFFPVKPLVSHIESVHDRVSVEIMRGCYRKCRFCQASYACSGVRKRSPGRIKELISSGLANTGYDEVTLLSLSTGDYPGIEILVNELMEGLSGADATLSLPSLRLDTLKEDTLKKISEYKRSGLTFAPEAGTQRLRDAIGKQITEQDLFRALDVCLPLGFSKFKFYFMIGLPGETYEDIDGIAELAEKTVRYVKALGTAGGKRYNFNLSVSVSNFVPKPATPFERARGDDEESLLAKIRHLKDSIRRVKGVGFKYHDTRMSRIEMLLAKGDRRMAEIIRLAAERGSGFDSWREFFNYENWLDAFADAGMPAQDLYTDANRALPWSLIERGKAYDEACI